MSRQALLVSAFLLFLNVSLVLCREDYQQYYSNHFSHHHRKSTPGDAVSTEAPVSSDEGVSASGGPVFAAVKTTGDITDKQHGSDDHVVQRSSTTEVTVSLTARVSATSLPPNIAVKKSSSYTSYSYDQTVLITRIVIIIGAVAFFLIALIVIVCCRPACCRGRRNPGYILSDNTAQVATEPQQLGPESALMHPAYPAQQFPSCPPGYTLPPVQQPQYPPEQQQYQTPQAQQQYQYSPSQQQYHNPPLAPPPYSEKY